MKRIRATGVRIRLFQGCSSILKSLHYKDSSISIREEYFIPYICKLFVLERNTLYCHVISHGDDRNKINTILPLEWTVATRQKCDR